MREYLTVSSIRIFILGSLAERGPMHGHQLRLLAEEEHVHLWTDITVGALYGAIKRLVTEGLVEDVRTEREGNYPERQVLAVTASGLEALTGMRRDALRTLVIKPDPFDLAMTRLDRDALDTLPAVVENRLIALRAALAEGEFQNSEIDQYLTSAERMIVTHRLDRIRAEIGWHTGLVQALPEIIADETARKESS